MCGITGIIKKDNNKVTESELKIITDVIQHRGPDGFGYYTSEKLGFGHRRLAIIDLSEAGAQPMYYDDKYVITFNGEIYNYIEVRNELIQQGYFFKSDSDTEVILASYDKWGSDCVSKFNGMWAFAIHDKVRKIVFCSRDRFGVKPFYYHNSSSSFSFGSEIKSLLGTSTPTVNEKILINYLVAGFEEYNEETFFNGIKKLPAGHNLVYHLQENKYIITPYYKLQINPDLAQLSDEENQQLFERELFRSISYRLRSDVKVGTCLSGGVDSSAIASISALLQSKVTTERFNAFTSIPTETQSQEDQYAEMVVKKSNLNWFTTKPETDDFIRILNEVIKLQEEPFGGPSVFMQYFVFQMARQNGCTVILDGQGGDESLLGYERYYATILLSQPWHQRILSFFNASRNSRLSKKELLSYIFYFSNPYLRRRYLEKRSSFVKKEYLNLLDNELFEQLGDTYSSPSKLSIFELTKMQLPHLLKYEDKNSMAHSIESRLPFLDYKLVETSISLPSSLKMKDGWTKFILRKTLEKYAPSEIAWRKSKLGFNAPEKTWIDSIEPQMFKFVTDSPIIKRISNTDILKKKWNSLPLRTKWKLFNIAKWESIYNVK